ncbi:MAG: hypothetical protein HUK02_02765 [Bacteroidaceae bacterium]|nr:hypothetical protein [Bacteroidaceae bacterium]
MNTRNFLLDVAIVVFVGAVCYFGLGFDLDIVVVCSVWMILYLDVILPWWRKRQEKKKNNTQE